MEVYTAKIVMPYRSEVRSTYDTLLSFHASPKTHLPFAFVLFYLMGCLLSTLRKDEIQG